MIHLTTDLSLILQLSLLKYLAFFIVINSCLIIAQDNVIPRLDVFETSMLSRFSLLAHPVDSLIFCYVHLCHARATTFKQMGTLTVKR